MNRGRPISILTVSVLLTVAGCKEVTFVNSLPPEAEIKDASAYIGSWDLMELFGKPYTNETLRQVTIGSNSEGRIAVHIPANGVSQSPFDKTSRLYAIGGQTYFDSPRIRTELDPTNGMLYVYTMDLDALQSHVTAGLLPGKIDEHKKQTTITVTATSQELATFVCSEHAGFIPAPMAVLKRGASNNTSDGIRQPADGLPKPSM